MSLSIAHKPLQKITLEPPMDSQRNMDIDAQHFHKAQSMSSRDYLIRLYEWRRPCISLGISQNPNILRQSLLDKDNVDVVKRITGGLAVYHYQEITYSVAASAKSVYFGGSLHESYEKIAQILWCFLRELGVMPTLNKKKQGIPSLRHTAVCFQYSGYYEISVRGVKVIGSAQKRGTSGFLQHGSIPVYKTQKALEDYLQPAFKPQKKTPFMPLAALTNHQYSMEALKERLRAQFTQALS